MAFAIIFGTNPNHYINVLNLTVRSGIRGHITIGNNLVKELALLSRYCKGFYEVENEQLLTFDESVAGLIERLHRQNKESFIIPICWPSLFYVSKLKDRFDELLTFPVDGVDVLQKLHNKWHFYLLLKELGIPAPAPTYLIENHQDLLNKLDLEYPVVAKPTDGFGGIGFLLCPDRDALLEQTSVANRFPYVIQEYIEGYDMCLNMFSVKGKVLGWTMQENTAYGLKFINNPEALAMGEKIVGALQFTGVANFDLRYDSNAHCIKFVECNPRLWGSFFYSAFAGVNFLKLGLDYAFKKETSSIQPREIAIYTLEKLNFKGKIQWAPLFNTLYNGWHFASADPLVNIYKLASDKGALKRLLRSYAASRTALVSDWQGPGAATRW